MAYLKISWIVIDLHTDTKSISAVFDQALIRTCKNFPYFLRFVSISDGGWIDCLGTGNERWIRVVADFTTATFLQDIPNWAKALFHGEVQA